MYLVTAILFLSFLHAALGQVRTGVSMKRDKSASRTYSVTYVPPATSAFASRAFDDTIFCAAVVNTMHAVHDMVTPMHRVDSALYTARITFPDSSYSVMLDVCIPTEQLPDGFKYIFIRPDSGSYWPGTAIDIMLNADSALNFERRNYPWNYFAYYQYWQETKPESSRGRIDRSDELAYAKLWQTIRSLSIVPDATFSRYFTLASLCKESIDGDSLCILYLDSAAHAFLNGRTSDYLLESQIVWTNFFSCQETDESRCTVIGKAAVIMQQLAAQYPRSAFGKAWLEYSYDVTGIDMQTRSAVIAAWSNTNDVDALIAIAHQYITPASSVYNPVLAADYLTRAERSSEQQLGFRNGENHFGSMGRIDDIRARMVLALSLLKHHEGAFTYGEKALVSAKDVYGRKSISEALVTAAIAAGDSMRAERYKHLELPTVPDFEFRTIDNIAGRLSDLRGKIVVIDFWFIGCAGCAAEHKSLNDFGISLSGKSDVVFLSIAMNDKNVIAPYLKKSPLAATIIPSARHIAEKLGVNSFPTHIIIDQLGKTQLWGTGGSSTSGKSLAAAVEKLLK